jgi:5-methylcytosine-specific restriction protein A
MTGTKVPIDLTSFAPTGGEETQADGKTNANQQTDTNRASSVARTILRPCSVLGCIALTFKGNTCEAHRREQQRTYDDQRGSPTTRGYDSHWRRLRLAKLSANPFCEIRTHCRGMIATEVHHQLSIRERPDLRLDINNLLSSCKPCHSAITRREQR